MGGPDSIPATKHSSDKPLHVRLYPLIDVVIGKPGVSVLQENRDKFIAAAARKFPWNGLPGSKSEDEKTWIASDALRLASEALRLTKQDGDGDKKTVVGFIELFKGTKDFTSVTVLKLLDTWYKYVYARCERDTPVVPDPRSKGILPADAKDFLNTIEAMGNPVIRAILEQDRINQRISEEIKRRALATRKA